MHKALISKSIKVDIHLKVIHLSIQSISAKVCEALDSCPTYPNMMEFSSMWMSLNNVDVFYSRLQYSNIILLL